MCLFFLWLAPYLRIFRYDCKIYPWKFLDVTRISLRGVLLWHSHIPIIRTTYTQSCDLFRRNPMRHFESFWKSSPTCTVLLNDACVRVYILFTWRNMASSNVRQKFWRKNLSACNNRSRGGGKFWKPKWRKNF